MMSEEASTQIYACESVSEGHPDKFCDQIVDAILDECMSIDCHARVGCEALAINNNIFVTGEFNLKSQISKDTIKECVHEVMRKINYDGDPNISICDTKINIFLQHQSNELSLPSNAKSKNRLLPNDQGITIGYACNYFLSKSWDYMPIQITLANYLVKRANILRRLGEFSNALPDMKSQVNYHFEKDKRNIIIDSVLLSVQHKKSYSKSKFIAYIMKNIINYSLNKFQLTLAKNAKIFINPLGDFINGGSYADTGLSGRKIVVDAYGPTVPNGGGSLCGKDITKIDRIGNYYARYIAKNVVAAKLCDEIKVEISYIISREKIAGINVSTYDTCNLRIVRNENEILRIIKKTFDFSPEAMLQNLKLDNKKLKFLTIAKYGHYGNNAKDFPWEKLDKVAEIRKNAKFLTSCQNN